MSSHTSMISNDIMRAVMDYISEHEKEKTPTKNFAKVGKALGLIRSLLEDHMKEEDSEILSVSVSYGDTDVSISMTLPADWTFDKKGLKVWKDLLKYVDEMSHAAGSADETSAPADDVLTFVINGVFE